MALSWVYHNFIKWGVKVRQILIIIMSIIINNHNT